MKVLNYEDGILTISRYRYPVEPFISIFNCWFKVG